MNIKEFSILIFIISFSFSMSGLNNQLLSNEDYLSGEDGIIRMYINVNGHVKYPGTYLVYDGIDFMTALSLAGGYLPGSNLNKVLIISKDGSNKEINLNSVFKNEANINNFIFKPHDTIYINEKTISRMISNTNLPSILLSILNVVLTIEKSSNN